MKLKGFISVITLLALCASYASAEEYLTQESKYLKTLGAACTMQFVNVNANPIARVIIKNKTYIVPRMHQFFHTREATNGTYVDQELRNKAKSIARGDKLCSARARSVATQARLVF